MGLIINAQYDSSVTSASNATAIEGAITAAVTYFESTIATNITVNINFGFGELQDGATTVGKDALAEALPNGGLDVSYATLRTALAKYGTSADDRTALANLAANADPTAGGSFYVPGAEAKALGLVAANTSGVDGYVGISNAYGFTYDPNNRNASGLYDAIGSFEHEIAHVLGRDAGLQVDGAGQYMALDLFRYSAAHTRELTGNAPGYFSINGGTTNLNPFDQTGGDAGDWAQSVAGDSFGYGATGQTGIVTRTDLREMDVLGYSLNLPTDTAAQLLSAYNAAPSRAFASISDTAANFSAKLDALQNLARPAIGAIASTHLTDGASHYVSVAEGQATSDSGALATIGGTYWLSVALQSSPLTETLGANVARIRLTGTGAATVNGNASADVFLDNNFGNDTIAGGGGNDTLSYAGLKTSGISVSLAAYAGIVTKGSGHGYDHVSSIEAIIGSSGSDKIQIKGSGSVWGLAGNDTITGVNTNATDTDHFYGGNGNDVFTNGSQGTHYVTAGAGNDTFNVGGGNSHFTIGTGHDVFVMSAHGSLAQPVIAEIAGFQLGVDKINLALTGVTAANADTVVHVTQLIQGAEILGTVNGTTDTIILDGISAGSINLHGADFILG